MTLRCLYDYVLKIVTSRRLVTVDKKIKGNTSDAQGDSKTQYLSPGYDKSTEPNPSQNMTADGTHVTYRERLGGYLHPRDMRRLVFPFSVSNEPELIVRRHVMLLNFDPLRAIVLRDRLLILVPDGADSILITLERALRGGIDDLQEKSVSSDDFSSSSSLNSHSSNSENSTNVNNVLIENEHNINTKEHDIAKKCLIKKPMDKSIDDTVDDSYLDNDLSVDGSDDTQRKYFVDDEWTDIKGRDWIEMPFELQSVDAVLSSVCKMLSEEVIDLRFRIVNTMKELRNDTISSAPGDHVQEKLRILKDGVKEMEARVQGFVRAMHNILDEEEDMALMNLSRLISHPDRFIQPVSNAILNEESDEPELILEAYIQHALSEVNALELLKGNILNTEELVSLRMDTIRNRLLYINTLTSVVSLCVAIASFVGSILGMNLINHLEDDENAFAQVVIGTILGSSLLLFSLMIALAKTGIFPSMWQRRRSNDTESY